MVDVHTHILPGMDDGSRSVAESGKLLASSRAQGIQVLCLTPHFYSHEETVERFLARRGEAYARLLDGCAGQQMPELRLGAEVAFFHGMGRSDALGRLCIGGSACVLVEMPFSTWTAGTLNEVYLIAANLSRIPVLAHVERYPDFFTEHQKLIEVLEMGGLLQINAEAILSRHTRKRALALLQGGGCLLGSDCHSVDARPQNLGSAIRIVEKAMGKAKAARVLQTGRDLFPLAKMP